MVLTDVLHLSTNTMGIETIESASLVKNFRDEMEMLSLEGEMT